MDEKERQRQYQEYLSLRENRHPEEPDRHTYGESEMRKIYREKAQREQMEAFRERQKQRERDEYMAARQQRQEQQSPHKKKKIDLQKMAKEKLGKLERSVQSERSERPKRSERPVRSERPKRPERPVRPERPIKRKKKKNVAKRVAVGVIIAVLLLAILAVGGVMMAFGTLNSMQDIDVDKNAIAINPEVAAELDGYTNIAVLGTDARADDKENARSDAIIVASINKETNEVKLFSVFRDTLLDVGEQGLDKITHAYSYGGAQQSLYTLNKNLDLNIDKVVVINWKTVAEMIDAVGGIKIDIQESEIEEMNKYIKETAKNVDGPSDKIKKPGKQMLNGVQAVTYSRIRKDAATGDYRRNERMKIVFSKTFKKLRNAGYFKMFQVARKTMPEVGTNMSTNEVMRMMLKFKSYDMTDSTTGFPYDVGAWTGYAGAGLAWYGPPINLSNNVSKLHKQFFNQDDYTPTDTVQEISTHISELTGLW